MNKHINHQIITKDGKPEFVVISYEDFINIYPNFEGSIPHAVVSLMIKHNFSRLKAWREYLGFTQEEIAHKLSISQAALSQIESNISKPRKITLQKLATIYELSIEQLR